MLHHQNDVRLVRAVICHAINYCKLPLPLKARCARIVYKILAMLYRLGLLYTYISLPWSRWTAEARSSISNYVYLIICRYVISFFEDFICFSLVARKKPILVAAVLNDVTNYLFRCRQI